MPAGVVHGDQRQRADAGGGMQAVQGGVLLPHPDFGEAVPPWDELPREELERAAVHLQPGVRVQLHQGDLLVPNV